MKKKIKNNLLFSALYFSTAAFAQTLPPLPTALPPLPTVVAATPAVDLQQFSLSKLLNIIFLEYKVSYVLDPLLNEDQRSVSLRWDSKKQKLDSFLPDFLDILGYELTFKNKVYYVTKKQNENINLLKKVYLPKNRTANYLTDQLSPFFPKNFPAKRSVSAVGDGNKPKDAPAGSAAAAIDQYADVVLFQGSENEWSQVQRLLKQIDTPEKNVRISAKLYEVNVSKKDGSAMGLLLTLGNNVLNVGLGNVNTVNNFIQLKNSSINAVFSAIDTNTNFKLINSPFLMVKDGKQAKFESGQDVPTLGSIITSSTGQSQQSVEYKPTGVIFTVSPKIRSESIDLKVTQTLSDVVTTTTGLAQTPTIPKRSIDTQVVIDYDQTLVIGGLRTQKHVKNKSGFFFFKENSDDDSNVEILLFLTVEKEKALTNEEQSANKEL